MDAGLISLCITGVILGGGFLFFALKTIKNPDSILKPVLGIMGISMLGVVLALIGVTIVNHITMDVTMNPKLRNSIQVLPYLIISASMLIAIPFLMPDREGKHLFEHTGPENEENYRCKCGRLVNFDNNEDYKKAVKEDCPVRLKEIEEKKKEKSKPKC